MLKKKKIQRSLKRRSKEARRKLRQGIPEADGRMVQGGGN